MPFGLHRDSNPGHLVGVPIHAQAANPNAELENTAGISDSNGSSWLYKQNMLHSTFYLTSLKVTLWCIHSMKGAALCFLSVTTSVGMLHQKIHMNSSPNCAPSVGKSTPVGMPTIPRSNTFLHTDFPKDNPCRQGKNLS